eukprot:scaffold63885_cov54-Attheya_sp.AAC.11
MSWWGQDQSRLEMVALRERKADVVGLGVGCVGEGGRIDWRIEEVGRSLMVQRGKSERSAAEAMGEDSVRTKEAERRSVEERRGPVVI